MCTRDVVRVLSLVRSMAIQRASDQRAQGLRFTLFARKRLLCHSFLVSAASIHPSSKPRLGDCLNRPTRRLPTYPLHLPLLG
jgi:hypothetical protein